MSDKTKVGKVTNEDILKRLAEIEEEDFKKWAEHQLAHKNQDYLINDLATKLDNHILSDDRNTQNKIRDLEDKVHKLNNSVVVIDSTLKEVQMEQKTLGTQLDIVVKYVEGEIASRVGPKAKRNAILKWVGIALTAIAMVGTSLGYGLNKLDNGLTQTKTDLKDNVLVWQKGVEGDLKAEVDSIRIVVSSVREDMVDVKDKVNVIIDKLIPGAK